MSFALHRVREKSQWRPSIPKSAARPLLLRAGLVVTALDRKLRFLLLFGRPVPERVAPPGFLQVERRQLQALPHLDGALHEFALGQRQRRGGPPPWGGREEGGRNRGRGPRGPPPPHARRGRPRGRRRR